MKNMNTIQKAVFVLGVLGFIIGVYGKWNGWDDKGVFILFYTGLSFMWISTLEDSNRCERAFFKRVFRKRT